MQGFKTKHLSLEIVLLHRLFHSLPMQLDGHGVLDSQWNNFGISLEQQHQQLGGQEVKQQMQMIWPMTAISNPNLGIALGVVLDRVFPFTFRCTSINAHLSISIDTALTPSSSDSRAASFSLVYFKIDKPSTSWPWRSAWDKHCKQTFAEPFTSRDQGIWMPFDCISAVTGWQDFGFKFYEGTNSLLNNQRRNNRNECVCWTLRAILLHSISLFVLNQFLFHQAQSQLILMSWNSSEFFRENWRNCTCWWHSGQYTNILFQHHSKYHICPSHVFKYKQWWRFNYSHHFNCFL